LRPFKEGEERFDARGLVAVDTGAQADGRTHALFGAYAKEGQRVTGAAHDVDDVKADARTLSDFVEAIDDLLIALWRQCADHDSPFSRS